MSASGPRSLTKLFTPDSIAVVGASETFEKLGGRVLVSLRENGYKGAIYPVNPARATVQSLRAYRSLEAIGEPIDLAMICLAANDVEAQVEAAARSKVGALIVFASGFAELNADGEALQRRIAAVAQGSGIPLLGPNCLGFMNGTLGLMASSTVSMKGRPLREGKMGFVSQSGAIGTFWMDRMFGLGLGCSKWVTTGNEADVTVSEALEYLVEDDATDIIGMYVEGFRESHILRRAFAGAIERRKPILVLRAGRSRAGAGATASHTGVLSGEDSLYRELFDQFGVCQVDSLSQMVDVSRVFMSQRPTPGLRTCVISLSGGAGALIADAAEFAGFEQPPLSGSLIERLRAYFPRYVQLGNPIDLTTQIIVDPSLFERTLEAIVESGDFDTVFTFMAGRTPELLQAAGAAMAAILPRWHGNYATIWQATTPAFLEELRVSGVLVFEEIPEAIAAIARAARIAQSWRLPVPRLFDHAHGAAPTQTLTEYASKCYLTERGVLTFPEGVLVQSAEEVDKVLNGRRGPWAVKLQSANMIHKSGAGGIELNLATLDAVRSGVDSLLQVARRDAFNSEGVLIETMEKIELEIIVGLRRDPVLGPYLLVGRGGVSVEIDRDVTHAFLPLSAAQIEALFSRLRGYALFTGHRGKARVPMTELGRAIARLSAFFLERDELAEIEINPLAICAGGRIVALDATVYPYAGQQRRSAAAGGD